MSKICSRFLNVKTCSFPFDSKQSSKESLGFGLSVEQWKQYEDITLDFVMSRKNLTLTWESSCFPLHVIKVNLGLFIHALHFDCPVFVKCRSNKRLRPFYKHTIHNVFLRNNWTQSLWDPIEIIFLRKVVVYRYESCMFL